ncbi:MAG: M15 family metallopeptidase, partial [Bdellovibrionota bacterium]
DMREYFFPDEEKAKLIEHGYIDARSGHSRGSTLDLTLVRSDANPSRLREERADCRRPKNIAETGQLDMGTAFDCFSELAHTANATLSPEARKNRLLLKSLMEKAGFVNYPKEWWHFSLKNEPIKDKFFDQPVK